MYKRGDKLSDDLSTFDLVQQLVVDRFGVNESSVNLDMTFDDLGADSLDIVELIMEVEDTFDIRIEDESIERMHTIGDAVAHIESLQNK